MHTGAKPVVKTVYRNSNSFEAHTHTCTRTHTHTQPFYASQDFVWGISHSKANP